MAIKGYTGWAAYVNRIILDATTITLGENAVLQDTNVSGTRRSMLRGLFVPEKYSVVMEFDWEHVNQTTGLTELQMFYEWYKYDHRYGTVPFEFPKILYSPQTGVAGIDERESTGDRKLIYNQTEFYKITSTVEGSKRGSDVQVKMTWESVYSGNINVIREPKAITTISANGLEGYVDVLFSHIGSTVPVSSNFNIYIDDSLTATAITGSFYDNKNTFRLYFSLEPFSASQDEAHELTISYSDNEYTLPRDTLTCYFVVGDDNVYYTQP